jgi:hypothetical protein
MNPNLRFSERTRKGVLGSVVLPDGSTTDVVNNEHWYAGLQSMLSGALIGMIVDPYLGERVNQASSPEETALKLLRREGTYTRQAQDLLPGYSPDQVRTTVDEALRDQLWFLGLVGSALIVLPTLSQEKVVKPF